MATAVKLVLSILLVANMGIVGAGLATSAAYFVWTSLNLVALGRLTRQPALGRWALPPVAAASGMSLILRLLGTPVGGLQTLIAVAAGATAYVLLLGLAGGFGPGEREALRGISLRARSMLQGRR